MKLMYDIFDSLHPKNSLTKGSGLFRVTFERLKVKYPQYDDKVLKCITSTFNFVRMRLMNRLAVQKKEKPQSDRVLRSKKSENPDESEKPSTSLSCRGIRKLGHLVAPR